MTANSAPLTGIRVVELARILAGPWAGQLIADLGGEVIKVERPESGDDTRAWGPPFVEGTDQRTPDSAYFHATNRGKRSVEADFATSEGVALVRALVREADVLIENFKPGGLKEYGLDYESLRRINPRLIYCSITGFGQTGSYAKRGGYDFLIQAMGGIMHLTGAADGEPQKVGVAFADIFTGLYSVVAIEAALIERERSGSGQHIDASLLDSQIGVLANQALNYLVSGVSPRRMGNAHPNVVPYQVFPTSDGHVIIATGNDGQFRRLCGVLGLPDLATDVRYRSNKDRVARREELIAILSDACRKTTRTKLLNDLNEAEVPAGPIQDLAEVFSDVHVHERGLRIELRDPTIKGGSVPGVRAPILMSRTPLSYIKPSPKLGSDNDAVRSAFAAGHALFITSPKTSTR